jgi:HK97 family phage prohead protease
MPCRQCENGNWRWGEGPCEYESEADCEAANAGAHGARGARPTPTGVAELERRIFATDAMRVERRAGGQGELQRIVGHAAVFNTEADILGLFSERIAPGAFARAIAEDDVRALWNHDPNYPLGRTRAGTLVLREDEVGLLTETVPPDTSYARDLLVSIGRGDVSQMSFAFRVRREEWSERATDWLRTILEVELFDVSPVTYSAYPTTDVGVRSLAAAKQARAPRGLTTRSAASIVRGLRQRAAERGNFY